MNSREVVEAGRAWANRAGTDETERWFAQRTLETHCPYIYPPTSRYGQLTADEVYRDHADWDARPPALYVHIPYCLSRCNFCNFSLDVLGQASAPVDAYLSALEQELAQLQASVGREQVEVCSIYIGGGTPTALTVSQLERLFSILQRGFRLTSDGELCIEVNPDTIRGHNRKKLDILRQAGVTRVSVGVQSFDDQVLRTLGRLHDAEIARWAFREIQDAGIPHINIDLMYELPGLSDERWATTLADAVELHPDSISMYELRIAPTSPLSAIADERAADPNIQRAIALVALAQEGYQRSSPNQFLTGPQHALRHYVDVRERLVDIIGLGVSAIACLGPTAFVAPKLLETYMEQMSHGQLTYAGVRMSPAEERTRAAILGFKSPNGVSLEAYKARHGISIVDAFPREIGELLERELIVSDGSHLRTSELGGFFIDELSALFFLAEDVESIANHEVQHLGVFWDVSQLPSPTTYIGNRRKTTADAT